MRIWKHRFYIIFIKKLLLASHSVSNGERRMLRLIYKKFSIAKYYFGSFGTDRVLTHTGFARFATSNLRANKLHSCVTCQLLYVHFFPFKHTRTRFSIGYGVTRFAITINTLDTKCRVIIVHWQFLFVKDVRYPQNKTVD